MNNIDDYNLPSDLLVNNNIKNLILLSSKTELNVFNKKKDKWVFKSKDTLLRDYEKIKKKELKSLEQIKKKELKEIQQINKKELKDTHYSLLYLSQLGNNNYSVFKNKIDILDKIYDCITHIDQTNPPITKSYDTKSMTRDDEHIENSRIKYSLSDSPNSIDNITLSSMQYLECFGNY